MLARTLNGGDRGSIRGERLRTVFGVDGTQYFKGSLQELVVARAAARCSFCEGRRRRCVQILGRADGSAAILISRALSESSCATMKPSK